MEESEKRRERLKAMRLEAAQEGVNDESENQGSASRGLSNPLIDSETASTVPSQYSSPRFDYYTDPLAAFSANKKCNIPPQVAQGHQSTTPRSVYPGISPRPPYPNPAINNPHQRMIQPPVIHYNQGPLRSPMEAPRPSGSTPQGYPPNTWGRSGPAINYNYTPNFPQGNYPNPNFGRGRGQRYNNSPHYPDSGRGRGRSFGNNRGSGPSGRRGTGSHSSISGEMQGKSYYRKEMVDDPWKMLSPVIWKSIIDEPDSWMPKSVQLKKTKISSEGGSNRSNSQRLAEYLASSFNESVAEEPSS